MDIQDLRVSVPMPPNDGGVQTKLTDFEGHGERKTYYAQNWPAYNKAQQNELRYFMLMLSDICDDVDEPKPDFGRPPLPVRDMIFSCGLKVYTTFSLRRFISYQQLAVEEGHLQRACSYASVSNFMRNPALTPVLQELIHRSSLPLKVIEDAFGVDSTGFGTSRFSRFFSHKHGKDTQKKSWVKAHIACGLRTQIVTAVELSGEEGADTTYFERLVKQTAKIFTIKEIVADKAYSSRRNHEVVDDLGGIPYILYRSNTSGKARGSYIWKKMFYESCFNKYEYMQHYHQRSNVETVFSAIKAKFGNNVRSRTGTAQYNEILLKILCYNLCVLVHEMHERGINPLSEHKKRIKFTETI